MPDFSRSHQKSQKINTLCRILKCILTPFPFKFASSHPRSVAQQILPSQINNAGTLAHRIMYPVYNIHTIYYINKIRIGAHNRGSMCEAERRKQINASVLCFTRMLIWMHGKHYAVRTTSKFISASRMLFVLASIAPRRSMGLAQTWNASSLRPRATAQTPPSTVTAKNQQDLFTHNEKSHTATNQLFIVTPQILFQSDIECVRSMFLWGRKFFY